MTSTRALGTPDLTHQLLRKYDCQSAQDLGPRHAVSFHKRFLPVLVGRYKKILKFRAPTDSHLEATHGSAPLNEDATVCNGRHNVWGRSLPDHIT
ncbi:MAG: hypothetical protein M1401_05720 [Chloroflexi bacterium]|nr:hypothetical protein [Chloroflexota bacterium]